MENKDLEALNRVITLVNNSTFKGEAAQIVSVTLKFLKYLQEETEKVIKTKNEGGTDESQG